MHILILSIRVKPIYYIIPEIDHSTSLTKAYCPNKWSTWKMTSTAHTQILFSDMLTNPTRWHNPQNQLFTKANKKRIFRCCLVLRLSISTNLYLARVNASNIRAARSVEVNTVWSVLSWWMIFSQFCLS